MFKLKICSYASRTYSRMFSDIKIATDKFVGVFNSQLTEEEALENIIVEDCLPKPRTSTEARRRTDVENGRDDIGILDELEKFEKVKFTVQRKKLRLMREPNGDNLAFGNESTQPRTHESNTANYDHEEKR
ncbi:Hypothetical predicted protein [Paramuricea clavata]|uniref:Uncharacterized protein n=1 Tax=Paramuricea clavata TaxID=317549 RepID=A0A6S7JG68_PARCT|nr:Hypothetical predicted protein [Paramuricea clavata]